MPSRDLPNKNFCWSLFGNRSINGGELPFQQLKLSHLRFVIERCYPEFLSGYFVYAFRFELLIDLKASQVHLSIVQIYLSRTLFSSSNIQIISALKQILMLVFDVFIAQTYSYMTFTKKLRFFTLRF